MPLARPVSFISSNPQKSAAGSARSASSSFSRGAVNRRPSTVLFYICRGCQQSLPQKQEGSRLRSQFRSQLSPFATVLGDAVPPAFRSPRTGGRLETQARGLGKRVGLSGSTRRSHSPHAPPSSAGSRRWLLRGFEGCTHPRTAVRDLLSGRRSASSRCRITPARRRRVSHA